MSMIVKEKAKKPAKATMAVLKEKVRASGRTSADVAAELGVEPEELKGWFRDGSMPYSAFLSLMIILGTKASTVFGEAKALLRKQRAAEKAAAAASSAVSSTAATGGEAGEEPSMPSSPRARTAVDAIDDGTDVEEEDAVAYEAAGDEPAATAEAAPGVPLTDKSSPEALPYSLGDFTLAKTDSTMTDVDMVLMDWRSIVSEALDAHSDSRRPMTPERKAKLTAEYPKPAKTGNPAELSVSFKDYESAQRFANAGYLNDLQSVVSKRHVDVTLLPLPIKGADGGE